MLRKLRFTTLFALALLLTVPALAAPVAGGVADVHLSSSRVEWVPVNTDNALRLTISGPAGVFEHEYAAGETPSIDLANFAGELDGSYSWRLSATPKLSSQSLRRMAEARANGTDFTPPELPAYDQLVQSGHFRVLDGAIVVPDATVEPRLGVDARGGSTGAATGEANFVTAAAGPNFTSSVYIQDSLCVGFDCVFGSSFGFDTIRLQENNLRIFFDDTSSSASFPRNDWRLVANGTNNGDPSYFIIQDATANRNPFTIEAGTYNNQFVIDSNDRIGISTATPVVKVHMVEGNTPTLRLDQDGSDGFQSQIWDVAGNEANFFIRDVTHGSALSFRIKPSAPQNSIYVNASGNVALGADSEGTFTRGGDNAALYIKENSSSVGGILIDRSGVSSAASDVLMELRNNGTPRLDMIDIASGSEWRFEASGTGFQVNELADAGTAELLLQTDGDLIIEGSLTAAGTNYPSSRTLKEGFSAVDNREVLERLAAVPVSLWNYKSDEDKTLHIGPMTEDFSAAFDFLNVDGKLNTIDLHGVSMAAIQGLKEVVAEKDARISELEQRLSKLESLLQADDASAEK